MDVFEADAQQREEELHQWWMENWKSIAFGVFLAFVIITAVFAYREYTTNVKYGNAADFYNVVMSSDLSEAKSVEDVKSFIGKHDRDVYGQLAALSLTKQLVGEQKYQDAVEVLKGSLGAAGDSILDDIVRLRIARISIEMKKFDEADASLDAIVNSNSFKFESSSLKGDAAYAQNRNEEALKFYEEALASAKDDEDTTVVKMKRDSLKAVKGVPASQKAAQAETASEESEVKSGTDADAAAVAAKTVEAEGAAKQ